MNNLTFIFNETPAALELYDYDCDDYNGREENELPAYAYAPDDCVELRF